MYKIYKNINIYINIKDTADYSTLTCTQLHISIPQLIFFIFKHLKFFLKIKKYFKKSRN